jgi:hypothetical protein
MININYMCIFLILFILSSTVTYVLFIELFDLSQTFYFELANNNISKINKKNDCEPLNKESKQYTVNINGETYPKVVYLHENKSINFDCLNKKKENKIIFIATRTYILAMAGYKPSLDNPFKSYNCPITNCQVTYDKDKLNKSNLVLFEMWPETIHKFIPKHRYLNQKYGKYI